VRIALLGEDNMHDAVLRGLAARWCPSAALETGEFRGRTKKRRRAELKDELTGRIRSGKCDCAAILLDADNDRWKDKVENERSKLPPQYVSLTAVGAPERNIECWLVADVNDFCETTGANRRQIEQARRGDPKGEVRAALKTAAGASNKVHEYTETFVQGAPFAQWMQMNCFQGFKNECDALAANLSCDPLPNERDSNSRTLYP